MRRRRVTFYIDDIEYLRKYEFKKENVAEEAINEICDKLEKLNPSFKVCYTLFGYGNNIDNYNLEDFDGVKININDCNNYQRGCILSECNAYFEGRNNCPFGAMTIIDDEVYI